MSRMSISEHDKWMFLLKSTSFFHSFDDDELEEFLELGEARKFNFHEYVIREGTTSSKLYAILRGQVNIVKESIMKSKTNIGILQKGDIIGEMAALMNTKRSASIIAASETFVITIDTNKIDQLSLTAQAKFYKEMAARLAQKLDWLSRDAAERQIDLE